VNTTRRPQVAETVELREKFDQLVTQRDALSAQSRSALLASEQRTAQLERQLTALTSRADAAEARVLDTTSGMSDAITEWANRVRRSEHHADEMESKYRALETLYEAATKHVAHLRRARSTSRSHKQHRGIPRAPGPCARMVCIPSRDVLVSR